MRGFCMEGRSAIDDRLVIRLVQHLVHCDYSFSDRKPSMKLTLMLLAILVGGLIPLQGSINAQLGKVLNHPLQAAFVSFLGGTLSLLIILLVLRPEMPGIRVFQVQPWYLFAGGLLGACFVTMVLVLAPHIGIANTLGAAIAGQLVMSVVFDHFGWLGLAVQPAGLSRIVGCVGLVVSLFLIQRA